MPLLLQYPDGGSWGGFCQKQNVTYNGTFCYTSSIENFVQQKSPVGTRSNEHVFMRVKCQFIYLGVLRKKKRCFENVQ